MTSTTTTTTAKSHNQNMGSTQSRLHSERRHSLSNKLTNLPHITLPDRLRTNSRKRKLVISSPLYSASTIWSAPNSVPMTTTTTTPTASSPTFWYNDLYPELHQSNCPNGYGNGAISSDSPQFLRLSIIAEEAPSQRPHHHHHQSLPSRLASMTTGSTRSISTCNSSNFGRYDFDFVYDHAAAAAAAGAASATTSSPCSPTLPASGFGHSCPHDPHPQEDEYAALELSGIISLGRMYLRLDRSSGDGEVRPSATECLGEDGRVTNWL